MVACPWATSLSPPNVGFKEKGPLVCLFAAGQGPIGWVTFFSPTPSPCRSSGSSSFQRLKAKLLESLCFYPPICRHLAGQGGLWLCGGPQGARARSRRTSLLSSLRHSGLWDDACRRSGQWCRASREASG